MDSQAERDALLQQLLQTIGSAQHPSRFLLVEGERGIGKTYLCQTLYRELAARQPEPRFWPADLHAPADRELARKATRPRRFAIPAGAMPDFAWLGISCGREGDGLAFNVLAAAAEQVVELRTGIEDALRFDDRSVSRRSLLELFELVAVVASLADVEGARLAEGGFAVRTAMHAVEAVRAERAQHAARRRRDELTIDPARPDLASVRAYRDMLVALTDQLERPTVLLVDDFQLADSTLLALLASLPEAVPRNLTVLCTADRGALEAQRRDAATPSAGSWLAGDDGAAYVRVALAPLRRSELSRIVRATAPDMMEEATDALVERARGNPYRLRLMLDMPRLQLGDERSRLTAEDVRSLPDRLEDLYREEWLHLPAPAQRVVAIASLLGPAIPHALLEALCPEAGVAEPSTAIATARHNQWLAAPTAETLVFPDEARREVAVAQAHTIDVLGDAERTRIADEALERSVDALQDVIAGWQAAADAWTKRPPTVAANDLPLLETAVTLAATYRGASASEVAALTVAFGAHLTRHGAHQQAAEHAKRIGTAWARRDPELGATLEIKAAEWWSDGGYQRRSATQLEELAQRWPPDLLATRSVARLRLFVTGQTLARQGNVAGAVRLLRRLAEDPNDEDNLGYRSSMEITNFALGAGDLDAAADEVVRRAATSDGKLWWKRQPECAELREMIRVHNLPTVHAARVAASYPPELGAAGRLRQDALMWSARGLLLMALAVNLDVVHGLVAAHPDRPMTLAVRGDDGDLRSRLGWHEQAISGLERTIADYERVGGVDGPGPDEIVTRAMHARALSRAGRHEEARTAMHAVQALASDALEPGDSTLGGLIGHLAYVLAAAGDDAAARAAFTEYADVFAGGDDQHALSIRKDRAWLGTHPRRPAVEILCDPARSERVIKVDEHLASSYLRRHDEDWALLFGTAGRRLRLKRTLMERTMSRVAQTQLEAMG